ncbi:MAG: 2'-5' RNA ligase family protein, partial [Frankiales bacterium]
MGGPLGTARVRVAPILSRPRTAPPPGLPQAGAMQPLIVTLALDGASQERFDELRRRHFPPQRNHLSAHLTLFHALPGELEREVRQDLAQTAERPPLTLRVPGLRFLGRGVAYALRSPELDALRQALAARWGPHLTNQDRQPHRP